MPAPATTPPLTRRGIPVDPRLRVLALGTFVNRAGAGATLTTFALYFTLAFGVGSLWTALYGAVIDVMGEVGRRMPAAYRGTAQGGLAASPSARKLVQIQPSKKPTGISK